MSYTIIMNKIHKFFEDCYNWLFGIIKIPYKILNLEGVDNYRELSIAYGSSAGIDLTSLNEFILPVNNKYHLIDTGLIIHLPDNVVGIIFPRSSTYNKYDTRIGVIDPHYTDTVKVLLKNTTNDSSNVKISKDERIAQLVLFNRKTFNLYYDKDADKVSDKERGKRGFGSSN